MCDGEVRSTLSSVLEPILMFSKITVLLHTPSGHLCIQMRAQTDIRIPKYVNKNERTDQNLNSFNLAVASRLGNTLSQL